MQLKHHLTILNKNMKKITIPFCILLAAISFTSCKKSASNNYSIPTTYTFTDVNDSNQAKLLLMADQIGAAINLGNALGVTVDAQQLKDMFNGTGGYFTDSSLKLNGSGLKLSDYCPAAMKTDLNNYFDSIALYSNSGSVAVNGVAGVATSGANKKLLLSANGIFYSQVVKKSINELCAYQIANVYMADSINSTTDLVKLAHYWDAAFGFFGVPVDFPTVTKGAKYFGSYSNQVNPGLNSNATIMNAFLKGRAAISNNDLATMKAQASILITTFDILNAACVVQEMHETETNIGGSAGAVAAYGTMSETLGFIRNFKYNTGTRVITDAQIAHLLELIDNTNPDNPDMYGFVGVLATQTPGPTSNTEIIAKYIQQVYGFTDAQLPLL